MSTGVFVCCWAKTYFFSILFCVYLAFKRAN